jgi:hypothetical protein
VPPRRPAARRDHLIAIGHVVHAEATDAEPLLYRRCAFGTLAGLPAT